MSVKSLLSRLGIVKPAHQPGRLGKLLRTFGTDMVLDVGANTGQYGLRLRTLGYTGSILSFEPVTSAYEALASTAGRDLRWTAMKVALADYDGQANINVSARSESSSLLAMMQRHIDVAPESGYVSTESVECKKLDTLIDQIRGDNLYLKLDVQGFEYQVLQGAAEALKRIDTVQAEMSLVPLYKGSKSFLDMLHFFDDRGYTLVGLEPAFSDRTTGQLLQVDGVFHRFSSAKQQAS